VLLLLLLPASTTTTPSVSLLTSRHVTRRRRRRIRGPTCQPDTRRQGSRNNERLVGFVGRSFA
jgi:hypothetical protein